MEVLEGECRLEQALIRDKRWRNLALLPISKNRQRYNVTRDNMNTVLDLLKKSDFDFIFIDCPAGIDLGFINAISNAEEAIVVTTPEITAIRDADRVAGLLEANGILDVRLLVNRGAKSWAVLSPVGSGSLIMRRTTSKPFWVPVALEQGV